MLLPLALFVVWLLAPFTDKPMSSLGLEIVDRKGEAIDRFRDAQRGSWSRELALLPDDLAAMVVESEDRRFRYHFGFDPLAIARAASLNLRHGRIRSGGSTITQQLARTLFVDQLPESRYWRKLSELRNALRLEFYYTKDEILLGYINYAPLPANSSGFAAAAERIFGRELALLSRSEKRALVVMLQGEQGENHFCRHYLRLAAADPQSQESTVAAAGNCRAIWQSRRRRHIPSDREGSRLYHFSHWLYYQSRSFAGRRLQGRVESEIDRELTVNIGNILDHEMESLIADGASQAAVVVLEYDQRHGEWQLRSLVGSLDFHDPDQGQVNGATSRRNAGSTLKPLLYGVAFDRLGISPDDMIDDRELKLSLHSGESFRPRNYDLRFRGQITMRDALANSRNIPAVDLLNRIGETLFLDSIASIGIVESALSGGETVDGGYSLALGSSGATLLDLTRSYALIASGGAIAPLRIGQVVPGGRSTAHTLRTRPECGDGDGDRQEIEAPRLYLSESGAICYGRRAELFSEEAAWYLTDILSDREARRSSFGERNFLDFPFDVAAKTGTSKDYRDSWTIGYTPQFAVGVWVGRFEGGEMRRVSGGRGAGRIFHQVVRLLITKSGSVSSFRPPLLAASAPRAAVDRSSSTSLSDRAVDRAAFEIVSPLREEQLYLDPHQPLLSQALLLHIRRNLDSASQQQSYRYSINGAAPDRVPAEGLRRMITLQPGEQTIRLYRGSELIDIRRFYVN